MYRYVGCLHKVHVHRRYTRDTCVPLSVKVCPVPFSFIRTGGLFAIEPVASIVLTKRQTIAPRVLCLIAIVFYCTNTSFQVVIYFFVLRILTSVLRTITLRRLKVVLMNVNNFSPLGYSSLLDAGFATLFINSSKHNLLSPFRVYQLNQFYKNFVLLLCLFISILITDTFGF